MEYLAIAVVFFILFGMCIHLDEKRKDQQREINSLYDVLSRQNDRLSVMQTDRDIMAKDVKALKSAVPALEEQVKELTVTSKVRDEQEKRVLEGMNNILNYDMGQAMRAAKDVNQYVEDDE